MKKNLILLSMLLLANNCLADWVYYEDDSAIRIHENGTDIIEVVCKNGEAKISMILPNILPNIVNKTTGIETAIVELRNNKIKIGGVIEEGRFVLYEKNPLGDPTNTNFFQLLTTMQLSTEIAIKYNTKFTEKNVTINTDGFNDSFAKIFIKNPNCN